MPLPYVSLFSGGMGLDLGLEQSGFEAAVCVENDQEAVSTIRLNRARLPILGDVQQVTGDDLRSAAGFGRKTVDLVVGGPPCQSFSVFGRRAGVEDTRGKLIFEFIRLVNEIQPRTFLMENVRGLLSMPLIPRRTAREGTDQPLDLGDATTHGSLLRLVLQKFAEIGYRVDCFVVNAVNYGAPQIRERLILIGNRYGLVTDFPPPQYSNRREDALPPFRTLGDVIGPGFKDPCPEVMQFSERKLRYLAMVPPGGNWRSLPVELQKQSMGKTWYLKGGRSAYWRKLSFAFPSPTVVTMPNHAGTSMCHPKELRAITVGEAAAIQEFPPEWIFSGNTTAKFRQVGNAVPVRLGRVAGNVIMDLLKEIEANKRHDGNSPGHRIVHLRPHVRTRTFWRSGRVFAGDVCYYEKDHEASRDQISMDLR